MRAFVVVKQFDVIIVCREARGTCRRHGRLNVSKNGTAWVEKRAQQARGLRRQRHLGVECGGVRVSLSPAD